MNVESETLGVYKLMVYYFTAEQFALSNIVNMRIKISQLDDLNDPYEFLGITLSNKELRHAVKAGRNAVAKKHGVICFSESWHDPLMWAHYADKHKGVCLGFDIDDKHIIKIEYIPELMQSDIDMSKPYGGLEENDINKIFTLKYEGWRYEKEVRVLVPLDKQHASGYYFCDFQDNMSLKEVILGTRCAASVSDVIKHLHGYTDKVTVFKSRIAFTKYEVVKNQSVASYE